MRQWLERLDRIARIVLVQRHQIIPGAQLHAGVAPFEHHVVMEHMAFVRRRARGHAVDLVVRDLLHAVGVDALHAHAIPFQALDRFAPLLRHHVCLRRRHARVHREAVVVGDVAFPDAAAVVVQARIVAQHALFILGFIPFEAEARRIGFVHLPAHRPLGLRAARVLGRAAQRLDAGGVLHGEGQRDVDQRAHRFVAVPERLEHVRFGHEADRVVQRCVAGGEARGFQEFGDAVVGAVLYRVHVRAGGPAARIHPGVHRGQHLGAQELAQATTELVGLRVDQRHRVAVVGAVGRVGVDHHVRVPGREQFVEHARRERVALDEVAVQVEVAAVAAKAELLRPVLVHARRVGAVEGAVDVVQRDEQEHGRAQRMQTFRLEAKIAHQRHAAVDAFRLARVDAVVVEEDRAPGGLDRGAVEHAVAADHTGVDRHAGIGHAHLLEAQHCRILAREVVIPGDAVGPGGGLVQVALFVGREGCSSHVFFASKKDAYRMTPEGAAGAVAVGAAGAGGASVNGRAMATSVPSPGLERTSIVPCSA